ncbi:unnamed protein product [Linum tenue]|uniref:Uncharacterized protein n=1 Tax=Linum tenue TaxID=586396 RepID=A0AAV0H5V6_9ROSI|nr:unnamed protein product [Linum tenue]
MENDSPFDSGKKTTLTSLNQSKIDDLRGEEAGWRPPDRGTINGRLGFGFFYLFWFIGLFYLGSDFVIWYFCRGGKSTRRSGRKKATDSH